MDESGDAHKMLVGKPEEKRPLRLRRSKWKNNTEMKIWLENLYWIYLAQARDRWRALVNTLMNSWVA
jgi:hypothetical protein